MIFQPKLQLSFLAETVLALYVHILTFSLHFFKIENSHFLYVIKQNKIHN